jgi:hypothetical protein
MNHSFDSTCFALVTLGYNASGDFLCKHEQEYITKKLNEFYHENGGIDENITIDQVISKFHEIVENIEIVYTKIKQSLWYQAERDIAIDEDASYHYRVGSHVYINDTPLNEYVNKREFAYYGYPNAYYEIIENFEDAPRIRLIDFDTFLNTGSFNSERKTTKRKRSFYSNLNRNIIKRSRRFF